MNLLSRLLLVTAFCAPVLRAQTVSVSPVSISQVALFTVIAPLKVAL